MIRIISFIVGLGFVVVALISFFTGFYTWATEEVPPTAEHEFHIYPEKVKFSFDGPLGKWDAAQLQRGYKVYEEVCAACHSMKFVAFRNLGEIGYSEGQVKALAAKRQVPGIDPVTGEATTRAGEPKDYFPSPYANDVAARAANNNAIPPDLSLMTKARHDGTNYVYSLLTGYKDPTSYKNSHGETLAKTFPDSMPGKGLYFNPYFKNLNLAMAPPLTTDGQVTYDDGTEATIDQMALDVSAFMAWTAEPTMVKRKQTGWAVLGFLLFATILAYLAYKNIWAGVKPKKNS